MITFKTLAKNLQQSYAMTHRATFMAVLEELRGKPDITINDARIAQTDAEHQAPQEHYDAARWPSRLHFCEVTRGVLTYKGEALGIALADGAWSVVVYFPVVEVRLPGGYGSPTYLETTVRCFGDTDELYEKITQGYKRFKAKQNKAQPPAEQANNTTEI